MLKTIIGWWFEPFFIFPYIGNIIIPIDVHIFQRGSKHQPDNWRFPKSWGYPKIDGLGKILFKWMIISGTPIVGNRPHIHSSWALALFSGELTDCWFLGLFEMTNLQTFHTDWIGYLNNPMNLTNVGNLDNRNIHEYPKYSSKLKSFAWCSPCWRSFLRPFPWCSEDKADLCVDEIQVRQDGVWLGFKSINRCMKITWNMFRLTGAFHAGNGWEWGLLGLITIMDHSLIPYV